MLRLDQWDKVWDNYHNFDEGDGNKEEPFYRLSPLPSSLTQIFSPHDSCQSCKGELHGLSERLLGICLSCEKKRHLTGDAEIENIPVVQMTIHGITQVDACSNSWGASLKYGKHQLLLIGRNGDKSMERELLAYAFSACIIALKKPCRVELLHDSAPNLPAILVKDNHIPTIENSILLPRIIIATKRHKVIVVNPSKIDSEKYYKSVHESIMLRVATLAADTAQMERS